MIFDKLSSNIWEVFICYLRSYHGCITSTVYFLVILFLDSEVSHSHSIVKETVDTKYSSNHLSHPHSAGYKVTDIIDALFLLEIKKPTPSTCFLWSKKHVRTLDGALYR